MGRLSTPLSLARTFLPLGSGMRPLTALTRALPSPETNRSGTWTTTTIFFRSGSALVRAVTQRARVPSPDTPMMISRAFSAQAMTSAPPRTRYGDLRSSILSL